MADRPAPARQVGLAAAMGPLVLAAACGGPDEGESARSPDRKAAGPGEGGEPEPRQAEPGDPGSAGSAAGPGASRRDHASGQDELAWHFSRTSRGPKLVYGERRTDNVRLMLRCPPGGDSVVLSFIRPADLVRRRPPQIEIRSGGASATLTLDSQESQLGGRLLEAVAPIELAPLQRFRAGSVLEVRWAGEAIRLPAAGAQQDRIRTFFEACGPTG